MISNVKTTGRPYRPPRFQRLVRLLIIVQQNRFFQASQLRDQLRVSQRTVFRDLAALQDAGVILVYNSRNREYQYTGVDLSR